MFRTVRTNRFLLGAAIAACACSSPCAAQSSSSTAGAASTPAAIARTGTLTGAWVTAGRVTLVIAVPNAGLTTQDAAAFVGLPVTLSAPGFPSSTGVIQSDTLRNGSRVLSVLVDGVSAATQAGLTPLLGIATTVTPGAPWPVAARATTARSTRSAHATPADRAALIEDFSSYSSTANFLTNPRGIWNTGEAQHTSQIVLDQSVGYGSSKQSMRYDWPDNGRRCLDYAIRPGFLKLPPNLTHVWVEFVVRFKRNFTVSASARGCASEYKLASMGDLEHGTDRWNIPEMQAGEFVLGAPGAFVTGAPGITPSSLWDGQPHVFRVEAALSPNGPGGILRFWVDGRRIFDRTGFTTSPTHHAIDFFGPGLNINQGPGIDGMSMWWHRIAVYTSNPGW